MVRAANERDYAGARHYHELLLDIHPHLYVDGNPAGVKAAMSIMNLCENELRLPLVPASDATYQKLANELEKVSLANKIS